ncbi:hypothetical protein ABPG75_002016 [Micractinium tetrahymenae]
MASLELAVDWLQRTCSELQEDQRPPELTLWLRGLRHMQEAAELLVAAPAPAQPLTADANPQLFKGLAKLLQALALQSCASNTDTWSDGLFTALKSGLLEPVFGEDEEGGLSIKVPAYPSGVKTPLDALQLLVAGAVAPKFGEELADLGLRAVTTAYSALWPGQAPTPADRQRLARRYWLLPPPPASSAASPAGSTATQQQRRAGAAGPQGGGGLGPASAADLARHAPELNAEELRCAAVWTVGVLGAMQTLGQEAHQTIVAFLERAPRASAAIGCMPLLWALRSVPNCMPVVSAEQLEQQLGCFEAAEAAATACECHYAAIQLAHLQCQAVTTALQMRRQAQWRRCLSVLGGTARVAQRARHALDAAAEHLGSLKRWLPPGKLSYMKQRQQRLAQQLKEAVRVAPPAGTEPSQLPAFDVPDAVCSWCKSKALHMRRCSACRSDAAQYCSKECQVAHWKGGHKQECAQLAAQRNSAAGDARSAAAS